MNFDPSARAKPFMSSRFKCIYVSIQGEPWNVLVAFADRTQDEGERARVQQIVNGFSEKDVDLPSAYQDVLQGKFSAAEASK